MRISDWSSDVCSSDLGRAGCCAASPAAARSAGHGGPAELAGEVEVGSWRCGPDDRSRGADLRGGPGRLLDRALSRSEEHTSEIQSLMRHSTAVLRLKQKSQTEIIHL